MPSSRSARSAGPAPKNAGVLCVWKVDDGSLAARVDVPPGPVHGLAISPDGATLLLGCGPKARGGGAADAVVLPLPK